MNKYLAVRPAVVSAAIVSQVLPDLRLLGDDGKCYDLRYIPHDGVPQVGDYIVVDPNGLLRLVPKAEFERDFKIAVGPEYVTGG